MHPIQHTPLNLMEVLQNPDLQKIFKIINHYNHWSNIILVFMFMIQQKCFLFIYKFVLFILKML